MALSNKRILEEMEKGDIIIKPFKRENLATSSYDVTLGEYYFRSMKPEATEPRILNIWSKASVSKVWGEFQTAKPAREVLGEDFEWDGIHPLDKIILIEPGETILAHTEEYIGGMRHITTMMKARSSMGRWFTAVCKCAGWGDVGFTNRWTMEITNHDIHHCIPLVVGRRMAQIIFFETGEIENADKNYATEGKYQMTADIKKLEDAWRQEMMLPALWKDRDIKKL